MSYRIDPEFRKELGKFGVGSEWSECYHCGNCTATCPLTEEKILFPRKGIRMIQMGLKEKISAYVEPWLCYYCGDCTKTCPRDANPGELMMALRRYLTSVYDWTGLSRKFYTSKSWEFGFILFFAALVVALFSVFLPLRPDAEQMVNASGGVMINSLIAGMSPSTFVSVIEWGDWIMAMIVAGLLISNILNMFHKIVLSDHSVRVPLRAYFIGFWKLTFNFLTQARFSKCDNRNYWAGHLLLMTGYSIMFAVIVVLLPEFQTEEVNPWYHWQRLLGYYATFGILYFLIITAIGRIRRSDINLRFSHSTDWLFIIMLGLTTITGILVHIFRISGLPAATYYTYVIHLAVLVPMILVEVPFSKWSHLAYRPFAIYFSELKKAGKPRTADIGLAPAIS
ncbi:MAG: 4Fe-4S dicluster domain-containing protein [Bacteroidales bacterium]|nr:4Fe-4S dicluster domain-containing protein [Bacteroidales bacterium]